MLSSVQIVDNFIEFLFAQDVIIIITIIFIIEPWSVKNQASKSQV